MLLWVAEYGLISKGAANRTTEDGNLELCPADFESLLSLTAPQDGVESGDSLDQALTLYRRAGQDYLRVKNYVGVVRAPSGTQVEILPKLSKRSDVDGCRSQLIKMLVHLMPLFELVLRYFLDQVVVIVKRGLARSYVGEQGNLRYLRGKLLLNQHIKYNAADRARFYCDYDVYDVDRPANRLIRGALDIAAKVSRDSSNQRLCRELKWVFDSVPPTSNAALDFASMRRDRSTQHYDAAMPLCELILNGMNPLTQKGSREVFSLLFPMERVFEDYVAAKLHLTFPSFQIRSQVRSKYLVSRIGESDSRMFQLRPDLELSHGSSYVIADTKWKLLNQNDRGSKYGIKESDMYQLFAYGEKYFEDKDKTALMLIYPKSDNFQMPLPTFWFDKSRTRGLQVVPFDLESDLLMLGEGFDIDQRGSLLHKVI